MGPVLRQAAAEARAVVLRLAAERLGAPRENLTVKDGVVSVSGDPSRRVTYGQLAEGRRIVRTEEDVAAVHAPAQLTLIGSSPRRLDVEVKVTGKAQYAGDLRRPGMLYAALLRPPAHGAALKAVDTTGAAMQMEGCVTQGMGYALTEELRFSGGKIADRNFDTYRVPRFSCLPKRRPY